MQCIPCSSRIISAMLLEILIVENYNFLNPMIFFSNNLNFR